MSYARNRFSSFKQTEYHTSIFRYCRKSGSSLDKLTERNREKRSCLLSAVNQLGLLNVMFRR